MHLKHSVISRRYWLIKTEDMFRIVSIVGLAVTFAGGDILLFEEAGLPADAGCNRIYLPGNSNPNKAIKEF